MRILFLFLVLIPVVLFGEAAKKVHVNNRVLAVVNGKVISVVDVMKKMDMLLYQYYPEYLEVPEARHQFYAAQWRAILSDLIDKELVIADAEEKQFQVSSGDVREELEEIFGPQVMQNLEIVGLSMDEAWKLLKAEITIRRMLMYQVRGRVYSQITPALIRKVYQERIQEFSDQTEATWVSITLKGSDTEKALQVAKEIRALIAKEKIDHTRFTEQFVKDLLADEGIQLTVSQPFCQKTGELDPSLQRLFRSMKNGSYSAPQIQHSRSGQTAVVRFYYLQEMTKLAPPSMQELEAQIREDLTEKLTQEGTRKYFAILEQHFHVSKEQIEKELPENFQPFELKVNAHI